MSELHEKISEAPKWGDTTDPNHHDPERFRYLVHGINPFSAMNAMTITAHDAKDGIVYDKSWGDQSISMYDEPERLAERVSLSMSLIDPDNTATWGDAGLIVAAPEQNVVLTSSSDIGAHNNNLDFLLTQAAQHGVLSGDNLLRHGHPSTYNEVVAVAKRDEQELQLEGFFYKVTRAGVPVNKVVADRMQMHSSRLNMPVIEIVAPGLYPEDKVDAQDGKLAINFGGNRYILKGFEQRSLFKFYDERGASNFIPPNEIEPVLTYGVSTGDITEAEAEELTKAYQEADKERQTVKVTFQEDGSIKEISQTTGYGADATRTYILGSGYGWRINLSQQAEEMQKVMLQMGKSQVIRPSDNRSTTPLSPDEADMMVEAACSHLSAEEKSTVQAWYNEKREDLENRWSRHIQSSRSYGSPALKHTFATSDLPRLKPSFNFDTLDESVDRSVKGKDFDLGYLSTHIKNILKKK